MVLHDNLGPAAKHPQLASLLGAPDEVLEPDDHEDVAGVWYHDGEEEGEDLAGGAPAFVSGDDPIASSAVGIELRFAPKGVGLQESVGLIDVLDDPAYKGIHFECLRMVSRLSGFCPQLALLLNNRESVTNITLDELAPVLFDAVPALRLLGVRVLLPRSLRDLLKPTATLGMECSEFEKGGLLHLCDLLTFDWQLAVGSRLTPEEFELLAEHAGRVVHFHDQFVYVDPQVVLAIRKRLTERKTLSKSDLLRAALSGEHDGCRYAWARRFAPHWTPCSPSGTSRSRRPSRQRSAPTRSAATPG